MTVYRQIVTGANVSYAAERTLKTWSPHYIAEVSEQSGRGRCDLSAFKSYTLANDPDSWPENQLPSCVVVSPGLADTPVTKGQGLHDATWSLGVAVFVSGRDQRSTQELVALYCAAVRACLLQHPSLGTVDPDGTRHPFASGLQWIDESYDILDFDDSRTLGGGIVNFTVEVTDVIDSFGGPLIPPDNPCEPPGENGIVEETSVTTKGL